MGMATSQSHRITFWVDDEGFHYRDQNDNDAKKKHVKHSDSIVWRSRAKQDFVIQFRDSCVEPPGPINGSGGETPPVHVAANPGPGEPPVECKYTVTLKSGLSDDPEIIIDPPGDFG